MILRPANPGDAAAVAEVHVRSWQVAYRGLLPAEYLAALRPEDRAERYTFNDGDPAQPATIVAIESGAISGFATLGPSRDPGRDGAGELLALYVDPGRWGRGVGLALMQQARARMSRQGFQYADLWVLLGNARAERFYINDGWIPDGARRQDDVGGVTVDEVRYGRALAGSR